jgi:hypothetical protein
VADGRTAGGWIGGGSLLAPQHSGRRGPTTAMISFAVAWVDTRMETVAALSLLLLWHRKVVVVALLVDDTDWTMVVVTTIPPPVDHDHPYGPLDV